MQRTLVHLVLLVLLWGYAAPALLGPSEADLPACCRGRGKHHCAMMDIARSADSSPAFRTNPPPCPYRQLGSLFNRSTASNVCKSGFTAEPPEISAPITLCVDSRASFLQVRNSGRSPPARSL
jgi:hypothetical protein